MTGDQRPRRTRWPLVVALLGAVLVALALAGGATLARPGATPAPIGRGTATALAAASPSPIAPGRASAAPPLSTSAARSRSRVPASPPTRLQIASLHLDARIVSVGVDAAGDVAIPADVHTLGWYRYGPAPGAGTGSIVVVGHVDSAAQGEGAFFTLQHARAGAAIVVTTADGHRWRYRLVGRQFYSKSRVPLAALFSPSGAPRLTLITCGGPFDEAARSYRDNVVVTARPA